MASGNVMCSKGVEKIVGQELGGEQKPLGVSALGAEDGVKHSEVQDREAEILEKLKETKVQPT
jgi:hypothetical protein